MRRRLWIALLGLSLLVPVLLPPVYAGEPCCNITNMAGSGHTEEI